MELYDLKGIAKFIVAGGKGILAADESNPTCAKRFDAIGVASTENNRRDYREMLFRSKGISGNIGGVILFDETIRQCAADGTTFADLLLEQNALPGIKVDQGLTHLENLPNETLTTGLEGLDERLTEYAALGARFTKWRAVLNIGDGKPSSEAIDQNMSALAEYAKCAQNNGMVPIVEPEVLMDGDHTIDTCYEATEKSLKSLFQHLEARNVDIEGTLLKPNMVTAGTECATQASVEEVARKELPNDGKMFKPPRDPGQGQASSTGASELLAEPESSRARPTAEQAERALDATPAASPVTVERKEMQESWRKRLFTKMANWVTGWYSSHARVMTEVVEIIEEAPRATPEMSHMVETSGAMLQEIDSVYEATRPRPSSSDRPAPYVHKCKATTQTFG